MKQKQQTQLYYPVEKTNGCIFSELATNWLISDIIPF